MSTPSQAPALVVANRGEIAVRILRAARGLGYRTVAVHPADDAASPHVRVADTAVELPGAGVAAYLDQAAVVAAAVGAGCTAVHPGYGFLSENAGFARRCADAGPVFVGPRPELLELFGDKVRARELAVAHRIPVLPATQGPTTIEEAREFCVRHGAVMVKAMAGGGGRGMRPVLGPAELEDAFTRCRSEAEAAFGDGSLYVEKLGVGTRHVEVQVVGDGSGEVRHLWDRDCTVQRRRQKLVEIAPAVGLDPVLRKEILDAATRMAAAVRYDSLVTVEFLVSDDGFWFLEANPRLQVEHTVTEELTGVDLVQAQIRLAGGANLGDVGLAATPPERGVAIQARVNLETLDAQGDPRPEAGTLRSFGPPTGPGVRVDTYGRTGYTISARYDSLLAKVIATGRDLPAAAARLSDALDEFEIGGVSSNVPLLASVLAHPLFVAGEATTTFVTDHLDELLDNATTYAARHGPEPTAETGPARPAEGLADSVRAPMAGIVVSVDVGEGEHVRPGDSLVVLEAMKMEYVVRAGSAGRVTRVLSPEGGYVDAGTPMLVLEPGTDGGPATGADRAAETGGEDWSAEVEEIRRRRDRAAEMGGPERTARQHAAGKLTVRERIDALADPGTFREIGALTGFAEYTDGRLSSLLPANFVAGTARIDGRKVVVGADDFTIRGSSGDANVIEKQVFAEEYAREWRLPVVRLLDGASGGGSVKMPLRQGFHYLPVNPGWDAVVDNLSLVPVVAAALGPTVGLGAARLAMSHLAILVDGIGQVFTAGPPVVRGGTGEDVSKDELGGADVHRDNGVVDRIVASEQEAFATIRRFLSYLPDSVFDTPPVVPCDDPVDRRAEHLLGAIPRNPRTPYAMSPILEAIFDTGSVFRYGEYGGSTVTALARLDGHPVGVLAVDPFQGATMSVEGAQAVTRLVDLCETFHLPVVSLTDQGGVSIGSAAERRGSIRHGVRAISAIYQARVPQAEIVLRRVFGVGGAGTVNRHRPTRSWAWPSGYWGSLPGRGGIEAAFRAELAQAEDPAARTAEIDRELTEIASPFRTAERFGVQDLIDPRDSRALLCDWVRDAYRVLPELTGRPAFGTRP